MQHLRLIADDLTGALDTAAQFTARIGPLPVFWPGRLAKPVPPSAAIAAGTREESDAVATLAAARLAPLLAPAAARISYVKLDSLLRGHPAPMLAAILEALAPSHCIIAPAFPFQRRVTRGGRQYAPGPDGWSAVGADLPASLAAQGIALSLARAGEPVPEGASLWDAETDADLARIAAAGLALARPVLWCGSAGLAGLLSGASFAGPHSALSVPPLARPLLGLFGSDHPVTAAQLRAAGAHHVPLARDGGAELGLRLAATGVALVSFPLPAGLDRALAAARIARAIASLLASVARPATLLVSGGETLSAVCTALGASHLEVRGQLVPGVPHSLLCGGRWDGVSVISKSGAFGTKTFLAEIIAAPA